MAQAQNKTIANKKSPTAYINSLADKDARAEARELLKLFRETTKMSPVMWGSSIIGFGQYHYIYDSGREGDFLATGFSMRKSGPTIYIMPGYQNYNALLKKLGPHKLGKSCLYLKRVSDVDLGVLRQLIRAGLRDLKKIFPVTKT